MRLALVGYGGVGRAFVELLFLKKEYLEKDITKYPYGGNSDITFSCILDNNDIDLLVEMTPTNKETGEPGITYIANALKNKIHVVTANKGPILIGYYKLKEIAIKNNVQLGIGCTTGGALPSINCGMIDMAGSMILSIEGVFNGTTNFIINEMELNRVSYEKALHKAQELGIAESDPSLDVEGLDTAIKLIILTNVLMNKEMTLNDVSIEGITKLTNNDIRNALIENKKYKLVGKTIRKDGILDMSVKLEKLATHHPLYNVDGKNKGVRYVSDTLGDLTLIGGASGVIAASASILRDIINIHDGYKFIK